MTDERFLPGPDDVVAYVLDTLSDVERARFEQVLAVSPALLADVEAARRTFAVLPAATAVAPPPALRQRVLDAARAAEREPGVNPVSGIGAVGSKKRLAPRFWIPSALAAAAVLAVVVLGVENARLRREMALQAEVSRTLQEPNVVEAFAMKGADGAFGSVLLDLDAKRGAVALHRLPMPAAGKVYRLWAEVAAKPVYCGDLTVGEDGVIRNQIPIPVESYTSPVERLVVTLEAVDAPLAPAGPVVATSG